MVADRKYTIRYKDGEVVLHSAVVNKIGKLIKEIGPYIAKLYISRLKEGATITIGHMSLTRTGITNNSSKEEMPWEQVKRTTTIYDGGLQTICIHITGKRRAWSEVPVYTHSSTTPNGLVLEWVVNELATGK